MVQNKKNFSSGKKQMDDTQDLDRKGQARTTDRSADASRSGSMKGQTDLAKDKSGIAKRDVGSRK